MMRQANNIPPLQKQNLTLPLTYKAPYYYHPAGGKLVFKASSLLNLEASQKCRAGQLLSSQGPHGHGLRQRKPWAPWI